MDKIVITSIVSMTGLGLFFAVVLAVVNQKLAVKEDPKIEEIAAALPNVNCGACGLTSCHQYAESLARDESPPDLCRPGGEHLAARLSEILGVKIEKRVKEAAILHCGADDSKRKKKAGYTGIKSCRAAHATFGGEVLCQYGCLGYGDCMKACPFGAITMVKGLPEIDKSKCTACGKCLDECVRKLITLEKIEAKNFMYIACSSLEKGADVRKACPVGCIACGLCQKMTGGIFHLEENLARVQCNRLADVKSTEEVVTKCPTKCIKKL